MELFDKIFSWYERLKDECPVKLLLEEYGKSYF